jgi:hypothetical protein
MNRLTITLLFLALTSLLPAQIIRAQSEITVLEPGITLERTLGSGQSHTFNIKLEESQYLQIAVQQKGIDVVLRAFSPTDKKLGEVDSPNGREGPENISVVSIVAGVYRIEVTPLDRVADMPSGRYEIKILELRQATDQEVQSGKNQEVLKAQGLALLAELADSLSQIRLPQTRVRAQVQTAELLWSTNEKLSQKLIADAIEGVKEYIADVETSDQNYHQSYMFAMQLRHEVLQALGPHDPELTLEFLRSTRTLVSPVDGSPGRPWDQELNLELSLAGQIAGSDPKRALRIAEDALKRGYTPNLIELVARLRTIEPELAAQLAKQIVAKLQGEKLLKSQEATALALGLLRLAHFPPRNFQASKNASQPTKADVPLLSDQEYKDLFEKTLAEGLSYKAPPQDHYQQERNSAQNILATLKSMEKEMTTYAPGSVPLMEKRIGELNKSGDPRRDSWQKLQELLNTGSVDAALEEISHAPREMRDQFYQQAAQKAANAGDFVRARQIVKDNILNPSQRFQASSELDQQGIQVEISKGRIEEALGAVSNLRTSRERATILIQIVRHIGPGLKRARALELLEQVRSLVATTARVDNQEQMNALLEIGRAFSRYDVKRAFEIVEPLLDQFNELSSAGLVLNGFGQQYYRDGELEMQNGSSVGNIAVQLAQVLGALSLGNFDRAKADASRLERPEVRIVAYLAIAQQAIGVERSERITTRRTLYRSY